MPMTKITKKERLKKIARAHVFFSVTLFFLYIILSAIYSPAFLLSDIRHKFSALADDTIAITARVLDPPIKPIISATASCANETLIIHLDWPADENSQTFSIDRDGLPLITSLITSNYDDTTLSINTSYIYTVTAHGLMGPGYAVSDQLIVTTPGCEIIRPTPKITLTTFDSASIASYPTTPETTSRKPSFSGTTNLPNAKITVYIPSSTIISAQLSANSNGYWNWNPPIDLPLGSNTLFISAKDPLDQTRIASTTFSFNITEASTDNEHKKNKTTTTKSTETLITKKPIATPSSESYPTEIPLDFSLSVKNERIFQGKELETTIRIENLALQYSKSNASIRYLILDKKGQEILTASEEKNLREGIIISKNIAIPEYIKDGDYLLKAEINFEHFSISREKAFTVLPIPLINFGGGIIMTRSELISKIGTISLLSLLCLLFWLFFFSREYWLYLHALRHITERNLERLGLFGPIKGRGVLK